MISKIRKALRRDEKGFTLIELLVVIAIIGLVITIAVPRVGAALDNSKKKAARASGKSLQTALELFHMKHNRYPNATDDAAVIDGAAIDAYVDLRNLLSNSTNENYQFISLPDTEDKAPFTFESYTVSGTTYELTIKARDKDQTLITITRDEVTGGE